MYGPELGQTILGGSGLAGQAQVVKFQLHSDWPTRLANEKAARLEPPEPAQLAQNHLRLSVPIQVHTSI